MKTASKVFIIIGMIFGCIWVIPLIVGFVALSKLGTARCKNDLTAIAVLTLLFCSLLGGIFMLCISDEELKANNAAPNKSATVTPETKDNKNDLAANLEKINKLKEQGLIDEKEYKELRKRTIDNAFDDK